MSESFEKIIELRKRGHFSRVLKIIDKFLQQSKDIEEFNLIPMLIERLECFLFFPPFKTEGEVEQEAVKVLDMIEKNDPHNFQWKASVYGVLGFIYLSKGQLNQAIEYFSNSISLHTQTGNKFELQRQLRNLGTTHLLRGELDLTGLYFNEAFTIAKELYDPVARSDALGSLALYYFDVGNLAKAEDFLREAVDFAEQQDAIFSLEKHNTVLGDIYRLRGEVNRARDYYLRSINLSQKLGIESTHHALNLGMTYELTGDFLEAERSYKETWNQLKKSSSPYLLSWVHFNLVQTYLAWGKEEQAIKHVTLLNDLSLTAEDRECKIKALLASSAMNLKQLEMRTALTQALAASKIASDIPSLEFQIIATLLLLQIYLQMYLTSKEEKIIQEAFNKLNQLENLSKQQHLHIVYTEVLFLKGLMKRVQIDFEGALLYFQLAEFYAIEQDYEKIVHRVKSEFINFQSESTQFQKIFPKAYEQAQMNEILAYLEEARRYVGR